MRKIWRTIRYEIGYLALKITRFVVCLLPRGSSLKLGAFCGGLGYIFSARERRRALESLSIAFPDKSEQERIEIARASFKNLGATAFDAFNMSKLRNEELFGFVENPDAMNKVKDLLASGERVVIIGAHLGNWEMNGLTTLGSGVPACALAKRMKSEKLDKIISAFRKGCGMTVVYNDESPRKLIRMIKDGKPIAFLVDQDLPDFDGIFVDFFGRQAYTSTAPVALARSSRAHIVVNNLVRNKQTGLYHWLISEPFMATRSDDRDADVETDTARWSDIVEKQIREYPEQWVWMHRRWRTTPERLVRRKARNQLEQK